MQSSSFVHKFIFWAWFADYDGALSSVNYYEVFDSVDLSDVFDSVYDFDSDVDDDDSVGTTGDDFG